MRHYCYTWIEDWCKENGWTDLFVVERDQYWAFPPCAVLPLPIPDQTLRSIKRERGMSVDERRWCFAAVGVTLAASIASYFLQSPMPLVAAFAFSAVTVAQMEED